MTEPSRAVFLSYASQDAEAARRICDALRAAGIEVWFDQSELRGGDAWDHHIRHQIGDCVLFVPIISAHTQARSEGYFRLEWDLADQRSHMIARSKAFIIPVCVDGTPDRGAEVPESFLKVQWTRLPGGATPTAFVERVSRLLSPGQVPSAPTRPPIGAAPVPLRSTPDAPSRWKRPTVMLIATIAVIGVGYFAVDKFWPSKRAAVPVSAPVAQSALPGQSTIPEKSIAVLPFADMSEKHDQEYFADGMAEEITDLLAKVPKLKVIARTSSFQFKGKNEDVRAIGAELGVAYVLEGSVRRSGDRVRITAQLIDAHDGSHRWSESYDRGIGNVLKMQEDVAIGLARALQVTVGADELSSRRSSSNPEAYEKFLRGKHALDQFNADGFEKAAVAFQQAVELDPSFTRAAELLAYTYALQADFGVVPVRPGFVRARQAAAAALQLDPNSAVAHAVLADADMTYDWDWAAAERELSIAHKMDPYNKTALGVSGKLAVVLGRWDEAVRDFDAALEIDPLLLGFQQVRGYALRAAHRPDEAEAAARKVLQYSAVSDSGRWDLALVLLARGEREAALKEIEQEVDAVSRDAGLAIVHYAMGRKAESDADLARLVKSSANDWAFGIAEVHAARGEADQAFIWLDRAFAQKDEDLAFIKSALPFAGLHEEPRYKALLRKMNLPE